MASRTATDGNAELINLWAGMGHRHARTGPIARVIEELTRLL
jgi:hypothetical protein